MPQVVGFYSPSDALSNANVGIPLNNTSKSNLKSVASDAGRLLDLPSQDGTNMGG